MINRQFALIEAARAGDLKTVQQLLAIKETNIDEQDSNGTTALMAAAEGNHLNMVNALLIWGANINAVDENRMTALMIASEKGYVEIVLKLLGMKAATNIQNFNGYAALSLAVKAGHVNVVQVLLAHGANPNETFDRVSALEYAAGNNNLDMARALLLSREKIYMTTAIEAAIDRDHVNMVLLLASNEEDAGSVLNIAAKKGNEKMVRSLLANHVKIDAKDGINYTALMTASEFGHLNIVEFLLAHPEAAKHTDASKQEAFMRAVGQKHLPIAHALLVSGAKINVGDSYDFTALMIAITAYTPEDAISSKVMRELLIWGSDIYLKNAFGNNALDHAEKFRPLALPLINKHVDEQKEYVGIKNEMESFFRGITVSLSATKTTFFLSKSLVSIIDEYASPTVKDKPAKKQKLN